MTSLIEHLPAIVAAAVMMLSVLLGFLTRRFFLARLGRLAEKTAWALEHVERVTREVARTIMKTVPGGVPDFDPFIRYHTFGDSSIDFTVILRAQEFTDNFLIKHEFIKALACAFAVERIVIPFPIRAINLEQEKARVERTGT